MDFAAIFLTPLLAEFSGLYPGIQFELDLTPRQTDLITENVDVAIRIGEPSISNLIARKLTQFTGQLFASPQYIERAGKITHPDELATQQCIGFLRKSHWTLLKGKERVTVQCRGRFSLNNIGLMKHLALQHQGIIFVPAEAVKTELLAQTLAPLLTDWKGEETPVYALTETRLLPAKTLHFLKFLSEKFRDNDNIKLINNTVRRDNTLSQSLLQNDNNNGEPSRGDCT